MRWRLLSPAVTQPTSMYWRQASSAILNCSNSMPVSANSKFMTRVFLLRLQKTHRRRSLLLAVAAVEIQVEDAITPLHIHRKPFEPIGQLARYRRAFKTGNLLEIGELRNLHAVAPAFQPIPRRQASEIPSRPRRSGCREARDQCRGHTAI